MRRFLYAPAALQQRTLWLALAAALAASPVCAQQSTAAPRDSGTVRPGSVLHVVRPNDTLHGIARRYLGDAARWRELFRSNSAQIRNPNLIYPGQKLYMGADGKPTFVRPSLAAIPARAPTPAPTPAPPVADAPDTARTVPLGRNTSAQANSPLANATINGRALRPTVRRGEVAAAPFLTAITTKSNAGSLVSRADPTVVSAANGRDQFQIYDEVSVLLPVGTRGAVGQRFGVYQMGPRIKYVKLRAQLVQPSGVIEVVAIGTGRAARARVTSMYANMKRGDAILPMEPLIAPETVRPSDVTNGAVYDVAYVAGGVVLPTLQNYVVIALPRDASSKVGDLYSLFAPGDTLAVSGKDVAPATPVAQVSVVRVTPQGATAIVVGQEQPAIRVGMKAKLVSRMP